MPKKFRKKPGEQKTSTYAGESGSTAAGRSTSPLEPASEEVEQGSRSTTSVPIGVPVSAQEYRQLKERASKVKTTDKENAQEDPAAA